MKKLLLLVLILWASGCRKDEEETRDYRQEMRNFVQNIGSYARNIAPNFIVIPQNGQELLTENGEGTGIPVTTYINAINGVGREDLFYGYTADNVLTPISARNYILPFLDIAKSNDVKVLVIDYCSSCAFVDSSYTWNAGKGYISFAASHRDLDNVPAYPTEPFNVNTENISSIGGAKNFLYLINPGAYATKAEFLADLQSTDYDVLIIDAFFDTSQLSFNENESLKRKKNGATRLVISYMSIGEAENYRYYWQESWASNPPSWLAEENTDWPGNYKVRYWDKGWQDIILGNDASYTKRILSAGFDGVYLDIIDAFEYFETQ